MSNRYTVRVLLVLSAAVVLAVTIGGVSAVSIATADELENKHSVSEYANEDGVVDTDGVREAIDNWRSGEIETTVLRDTIDAWRSGEQVVDSLDFDQVRRSGLDTVVVETNLSADEPTSVEVPTTQAGAFAGTELTELKLSTETDTNASFQLVQKEGPTRSVPGWDTGQTVLTHYTVDADDDGAVDEVTFTFDIDRSVAGDSEELAVYRYEDEWEPLEITVIDETDDAYVVEATSPGFSIFAVSSSATLYDDDSAGPSVVESVDTYNPIDRGDDGYLQGFEVETEVDLTDEEIDDPHLRVRLDDGTHLATRQLGLDFNGTVRTAVEWNDLSALDRGTYDLEAHVFDGSMASDDWVDSASKSLDIDPFEAETDLDAYYNDVETTYQTAHEQTYNPAYRAEVAENRAEIAANLLNSKFESMVAPSLKDIALNDVLERMPHLQKAKMAAESLIFTAGVGGAIEQESTAILLSETEPETTELRTQFAALEQNTAALTAVRAQNDQYREEQLLEERRELLRETYEYLPEQTDALHDTVIDESVGIEDRNTYAEIRSQSELYRTVLQTDYALTTNRLTGAPEPLAGTDSMPIEGWQTDDRTVIYDTIEHEDDYTVYRANVSEELVEDNARFEVQGTNVDEMDAIVLDDQPFDPLNATGQQIESRGHIPILPDHLVTELVTVPARYHEVDEPGEYYIIVRSAEEVGAYQLLASTTASTFGARAPADWFQEPVPVEPITSADQPGVRPEVDLEEAPAPFELEETDHTVYAADDGNVTLQWDVWDATTRPSGLEYRYRIDRGSGFSDLSEWQNPTADGELRLEPTLEEGVNRVQIVVRNDQQMQTVDSRDIVVTTFEPQTYLVTDDDVTSNNLFVRVLPDRRIAGVEVQYREPDAEEWNHWQTITETTDLGKLEFPETGTYEFRARAYSPNGASGDWDETTFSYFGPPTVSLETAPEQIQTGWTSRGSVSAPVFERVTDDGTPRVAWNVSSDLTKTEDLEYRTGVAGPDVDDEWSSWTSVPESGTVEHHDELPEGEHDIKVEVRDGVDQVTDDSVTVVIDQTPPTVDLTAATDIERGLFNVSLNQRVRTLQFEYRPVDENAEWESLRNESFVNTRDYSQSIGLDPGEYEVRVRGVDYTGAVSDWVSDTVKSIPAEDDDTELDKDIRGNYSSGDTPSTSFSAPSYRADVSLVSGEAIVSAYIVTRDGREEQLTSIELTDQKNQTLEADVPGELLEEDLGMELRVEGDGTIFLDSLRAFRAELPDAQVSVDPSEPIVGENTTFSVDTDEYVDGSVTAIEWNLTDDGATDVEGDTVHSSFEEHGNQTAAVTVTDVFDRSRTTPFNVTVLAPPEANLSVPEQELTLEEVELDATGSSVPDGDIVAYEWRIGDETFESDEAVENRTFDRPGEYEITLRVTDDDGLTDRVNETIEIENRPPIVEVDIRTDETRVEAPVVDEPIILDGSDSFDKDGEIERYEWIIDGERVGDEATTSYTFEEPGTYEVSLNITDDWGDTNQTMRTIDVREQPGASFEDGAPVLTFEDLPLDSTAGTDPAGEIESHEWFVGDESTVEGSNVTVEFERPGEYNITHRVVDDVNAVDEITRSVEIENRPPIVEVDIRTDETRVEVPVAGEPVTLDGGDSFDKDGEIERYEWTVDGEDVSDQPLTSYTFEEAGIYEVSLNITDDWGDTNQTTRTIDVREQPTVDVEGPTETRISGIYELQAEATADSNGSIVDYDWEVPDNATASPEADELDDLEFETAEEHLISVTVTDDVSATDSAILNLTAIEEPPQAALEAPATAETGEEIQLSAENSTDSFGEIVTYEWAIGGSIDDLAFEPGNETRTVSFAEEGFYNISVRVTADDEASDTVLNFIEVTDSDSVDNREQWRFNASGAVASSPTVVDDTVFVGSGKGTGEGNLYAVDAETGDQKWSFSNSSGYIQGSPTMVDETVYVGSSDRNVYSLNAETGKPEWVFDSGPGVPRSTVVNETVFVASGGEALYAVDAETGEKEWEFTDPGIDDQFLAGAGSSPTVVNETVYVGSYDETLYAVDAETGEKEWAFTDPSDAVISSPTVVDETVYVGSEDESLYAVDVETGEKEWTFTGPSDIIVSSPTVDDGTVFIGSNDTNMYAVDSETGEKEWAFTDPSDAVISSPTVVDGTVFVGSGYPDRGEGNLYAVDAETGNQEWTFTDPSDIIISSPTVVGGTVFVGSSHPDGSEGNLYAIDADVDGSSEGSRVTLGTLGHHHVWNEEASSQDSDDSAPSPDEYDSILDDMEGDGTEDDPYVVTDVRELQAMAGDLSAHYVLGGDIDASETEWWNDEAGFDSIGAFNGSLYAREHSIENLSINRSDEWEVALFSDIESGGTVEDLRIENISVLGLGSIGGIAGSNNGDIVNSYVGGEVKTAINEEIGGGGLVGHHRGKIVNSSASADVSGGFSAGGLVAFSNGAVIHSSASGDVTDGDRVGGMVGINNGQLVEVAAEGDVEGSVAGGLAGESSGVVTTSYSHGTVSGADTVGGVVGHNEGSVNESYAAGHVIDANINGGLVGQNGKDARFSDGDDGVLGSSYWDVETTNQTQAVGQDGGDDTDEYEGGDSIVVGEVEGLNTNEMTGEAAVENMSAFDFDDTWETTRSYPVLVKEDTEQEDAPSEDEYDSILTEMDGDGSADDPYVVTDVRELQAMDGEPDAHYVLGDNIGADETADWNDGSGFRPVGDDTPFNGSLDGQSNEIHGLVIDRPDESGVGLFSATDDAVVSDLSMFDADITGGSNVGILVGSTTSDDLSGVHVDGSVDGNGHEVGGLAGAAIFSDIDAAQASVKVESTGRWTGGLVGFEAESSLTNSSVEGEIIGTSAVGGVVGFSEGGEVKYSDVAATVEGGDTVGGIVGENYGPIHASSTGGEVIGGETVGGLVGKHNDFDGGQITESHSTSDVTGETAVGGLAGSNAGTLTTSYATGEVDGSERIGGVVGVNEGTINETYAVGFVHNVTDSGGLIGQNGGDATDREDGEDGELLNSYWDVETTSQADAIGQAGGDDTDDYEGGESVVNDEFVGLTTEEMTGDEAVENMRAFDFEQTWKTTESYPRLGQKDADDKDSNLSKEGEFTVNFPAADDHYPGSMNEEGGSIEYFVVGEGGLIELGAEEGIFLDWVTFEADWIDYSACDTENTEAFGIDRGNNNSGTAFDEDLLQHMRENNFRDDGLDVWFYNWDDFAGDPPYLAPEDAIVAAQGEGSAGGPCLTLTDEPGWYQVQAFLNGTVADNGSDELPSDDAEQVELQLDSNYLYVCECDSEAEAREELGPPPNE